MDRRFPGLTKDQSYVIHEEDENESDSESEQYHPRMGRTGMIQKLDHDHANSSGEDERFNKLNKMAGKYKKEEVFGKFKSKMLVGSEEGSADEEVKNEISSSSSEEEPGEVSEFH